jgi:hypothetical protein
LFWLRASNLISTTVHLNDPWIPYLFLALPALLHAITHPTAVMCASRETTPLFFAPGAQSASCLLAYFIDWLMLCSLSVSSDILQPSGAGKTAWPSRSIHPICSRCRVISRAPAERLTLSDSSSSAIYLLFCLFCPPPSDIICLLRYISTTQIPTSHLRSFQ